MVLPSSPLSSNSFSLASSISNTEVSETFSTRTIASPGEPSRSTTFPSSSGVVNSTSIWSISNSTYPSTITSKPTSTSEPTCHQGQKGCDSNTNTAKTEIICKRGEQGCDSDSNPTDTIESFTLPTISSDPLDPATSCSTLSPGDPGTTFIVKPNTTTITYTITFGGATPTLTLEPEFTPPCYTVPPPDGSPDGITATLSTILPIEASSTAALPFSTSVSYSYSAPLPPGPTTIITTSKNPVTVFVTESAPNFPGGPPKTDKQTVTPTNSENTNTIEGGAYPSPPGDVKTVSQDQQQTQADTPSTPRPTTTNVKDVPVIVNPTQVIIGGYTIDVGSDSTTKVTANGQTFTVNPSQVIGPGVTIPIPINNGGGAYLAPAATPTSYVIGGASIQLGASIAVIGGTTYSIGAGAPQKTVVTNGQTISIGPNGVGFAQTTIATPFLPTNIVILDPDIISAVGSDQAVIGDHTFSYGSGVAAQTDVHDGETFTIGPSGIGFGTTTIGGPAHPSGTQLGIAGGMHVTEIGSSIAVISGTTFLVGPGATATTAVLNGKTVVAGSAGLSLAGTVLSYPFNQPTQVITAGDVAFTAVGSLVNIGGTTYTIGPGAATTTEVYNGQTISLGPGGVGFKTTTVSATSSPSATSTGKKKNGAVMLGSRSGVLGICIVIGVWLNA